MDLITTKRSATSWLSARVNAIALFLFSAQAWAIDLPGGKLIDEVDGWMFGTRALAAATVIWAIIVIMALMPNSRVGKGAVIVGALMIILWFGAPTYVPLFKGLV